MKFLPLNTLPWRDLLPLTLLIVVSFALYAPSIDNALIWDSAIFIGEDRSIRDIESIPQHFSSISGDLFNEVSVGYNNLAYYRPLVQTLFTLGYVTWGETALAWHLSQVLLHLLMVALVYLLLLKIGLSKSIALFATLLFSVHPGKAEGVVWVYGLSSQLVAILIIATLLSWQRRSYIGVAFFTSLALLSRETAVLIPLLLLMAEWLLPQGQRRWHFVLLSALLVASYLILRTAVVGSFPPLTSIPPGDYLLTLLSLISTIGGIILLPLDGVGIYPFVVTTSASLSTLLGVVITAGFLALCGYFYRQEDRISLFWMAWTLLWLVMWFNLGRFGLYLFTEKAIYLALLGPCVIAATQLLKWRYGKPTLTTLIIGYILLTLWRGSFWDNQIDFFTAATHSAPKFAIAYYQLGLTYGEREQYQAAVINLRKAAELAPDLTIAHNNLGNSLWMLGQYDQAAEAWQQALQSNPSNPLPAYNLGMWAESKGDMQSAIYYYRIYAQRSQEIPPQVQQKLWSLGIRWQQ